MNADNFVSKIDTKEKMYVITLGKAALTAKTAEAYKSLILPYLEKEVKNLVLDFANVQSIDAEFAGEMVKLQKLFYKNKASMVFCSFRDEIIDSLNKYNHLDQLNYTPTESEAWDIVQMEEIERELF